MSNKFLTKPTLPKPFPSQERYYKCPKTGLLIPKFEEENIEWRRKLLKSAEKDIGLQNELKAACKESLLYFINAFVFTYHQFDIDPATGKEFPSVQPHRPFITWDIQDSLFENFIEAFQKGHDFLIEKSRDMGASWCCLTFLHHMWLFRNMTEIREMSRTENYVDSNAKSLFWKHDYINIWLPDWMRPPNIEKGGKSRTKMNMVNELNGSTLAGESTTEYAMSGDRCAVILLDEFAKVKNGSEIRTATEAVAPCRIVNSTPFGAGTEYSRWKKSGQIKVFSMLFWEHPEKGRNRTILQNQETDEYEITSPWFEHKKKKLPRRDIAQEILAEDLQSGDTFFEISNIQKHIKLYGKDPIYKLNVSFKDGIANDKIFRIIQSKKLETVKHNYAKTGKLSMWTHLINDHPDQLKTYIFGIDTSKGQGASESVVSIKCKQTGEKIAEWSDRNTPPYEFARIIVALALWCGGAPPRGLPFLKWEMNGPGWDLGRLLVKEFHYPFYYVNIKPGTTIEKRGKKYGWHSSKQSKAELLGLYDKLLAHGGYINHSKRGLEQAMYYITFPDGSIGPAELSDKKLAERMLHGDIVIADALTLDDREVPKVKHKGPIAPFNSVGYRKKLALAKRKKPKSPWKQKFDFTIIK